MGYRSEVAIKCESKAFERFAKVFNQKDMCITPDKILHDAESGDYFIYWDWIKWYENFDEIAAIETVMSELDGECNGEVNNHLGYRFMRIGEDNDDVETRGNTYDIEIYMTRMIDIPDYWETYIDDNCRDIESNSEIQDLF